MEKSERAFMWATEEAVGDVKEEDRGNAVSNRSHLYSYSVINTYMTIHMPSEQQNFCPESLFRGNKMQLLHDWEMPRYEHEANHLAVAAYG